MAKTASSWRTGQWGLPLLLFLGGVPATVAVSWYCSAFRSNESGLKTMEHSRTSAWPGPVPANWAPRPDSHWGAGQTGFRYDAYADSRFMYFRCSCGWPLASMAWEHLMLADSDRIRQSEFSYRGGIAAPWSPRVGPAVWHPRLPFKPISLGFAADAALFGTVLALPVVIIRVRRALRPGLCRNCGYSRAGLPLGAGCPECGAPGAAPKA